MSDKLTDTVSSKISHKLHQQSLINGALDGYTMSSLIEHLLTEYVDGKRALYLQLSRAFDDGASKSDLPCQPDGEAE